MPRSRRPFTAARIATIGGVGAASALAVRLVAPRRTGGILGAMGLALVGGYLATTSRAADIGLGLLGGGVIAGALSLGAPSGPASPRLTGGTFLVNLPTQPFPGQTRYPGVLIHVPPGYDPARPLDLVVYFRGLGSCVSAVAASSPTACRPGGGRHHGSHLVEIFDQSRVNAILVLPELRVESGETDPGTFARTGGFRAFLGDLLAGPLATALGGARGVDNVRSVYLASHSGGWDATSSVVAHGGVPVRGVALFDSFYGGTAAFRAFAGRVGRGQIAGGRFSSVYTGGLPAQNSAVLASELERSLPTRMVHWDTSHADMTVQDFVAPPVYFKAARIDHPLVPERTFGLVLAGGGFDSI